MCICFLIDNPSKDEKYDDADIDVDDKDNGDDGDDDKKEGEGF